MQRNFQPLDIQLKKIEDIADELHTLCAEVYGNNSEIETLALMIVGRAFAAHCDSLTMMQGSDE